MKFIAFLAGGALFLSGAFLLRADEPVIVHEWGTFTCLQDENGQAIGGINVDDEPVPNFVYDGGGVHSLGGESQATSDFGLPPYGRCKGWTPGDQDVTMRLETPVLYIYPSKGESPASVPPLQVHVDFHGGILSQYYPYADCAGFPSDFPWDQKIDISKLTTGLTWKDVRLGARQRPVQTTDKVWTTPRETAAPVLSVAAQAYNGNGGFMDATQAEHFLFYRGVGHLDSPLYIRSGAESSMSKSGAFSIEPSRDDAFDSVGWLVEIKPNGNCAFRNFSAIRIPDKAAWIPKDSRFSPLNFDLSNVSQLKASMQAALVKEGLYSDEASAMLRTWELSYFKSPGLRFFYIVPRKWVDAELPLKVTGAPAQITRVMVGRIELISESQKETLSSLASGSYPDLAALKQAAADAITKGHLPKAARDAYYQGALPLAGLGIAIPQPVQDYFSLGRFRDALIVHQQSLQPSDNLARFIRENGLASAP